MLNAEVIGNLGSDAVIREFNGKSYVSFSVAHEKTINDGQGGKTKIPVWVSVLWYGEGGGVFPFLKTGTKVFVRGRQDVKMYDDRNGNKQIAINLDATEVVLCGSRNTDSGQQQATGSQQPSNNNSFPPSGPGSDDLPF